MSVSTPISVSTSSATVSPKVSPEVTPAVGPEVSPTVVPRVGPTISPDIGPDVSLWCRLLFWETRPPAGQITVVLPKQNGICERLSGVRLSPHDNLTPDLSKHELARLLIHSADMISSHLAEGDF